MDTQKKPMQGPDQLHPLTAELTGRDTMRLSRYRQCILKALHTWKFGCGTNTSEYLFPSISCCKIHLKGNSRLVISRRSWYIFFCRTSGLDRSTATRALLSATRGDPASSSVRRWVEMLAGRKIRMRDCCPPSIGVPLGNLARDGSPPVKGQCVCRFRRCLVSLEHRSSYTVLRRLVRRSIVP